MLLVKTTIQAVYVLFIIPFCRGQTTDVPPKIKIHPKDGHQNITLVSPKVYYTQEPATNFMIECTASYPIRWNLSGIYPSVQLETSGSSLHPKDCESSNQRCFTIWINCCRTKERMRTLVASLRATCEMIGDPRMSEEIMYFARGDSKETLIKPKTTTVVDSTLIPCPTLDPRVVVNLYRKLEKGEELFEDEHMEYLPFEGYRSEHSFPANKYVCRQGSSSVQIEAMTTPQIPPVKYHIAPKSNLVRAFTEDAIQLECFSKFGPPTKLLVNDTASTIVTINYQEYGKSSTLKPEPTLPNYFVNVSYVTTDHGMIAKITCRLFNGLISIKGKAVCLTSSAKNNIDVVPVTEWEYEFVQTPELVFNEYHKQSEIWSPSLETKVQIVICKNGVDCSFKRTHCMEESAPCNYRTIDNQETGKITWADVFSNSGCDADTVDRKPFWGCVGWNDENFNGLIISTVAGLEKRWQLYSSLEQIKYTSEIGIPKNKLVQMDETSPIQYANGTTHFLCETIIYHFSTWVDFEIEFKNGSKAILKHDPDSHIKITHDDHKSRRSIHYLNIVSTLDINLPHDAVKISCHAPFRNSTSSRVASVQFETRYLIKPHLLGNENVSQIQHETLYIGEKKNRLACPVKGEPQPEYTWLFNGSNKALEIFPKLSTSLGSNGEGYLEFPEIDVADGKLYSGEYTCTAKNKLGEVGRKFQVVFSNDKPGGANVIYIVAAVVGLSLFILVLVALIVFIIRYKKAKERLRSLTDTEIEEFFQGRPELVGNGGNGAYAETVEFRPYNSEFEISKEDLELENSKNNMLGSGEFSYVLRGRIKSRGKLVAVKICKSSTDVTLFKSLLSEVKIMIYLGPHENVMALLGVCTENIRNRSIYIATDICELGSIDMFLRKSRSTFVNLINGKQQIDVSLLPTNFPEQIHHISTLDLVVWAAQIARGMEYLAYKSVIHADLATRNVLLTADKIAKITDFGLSKKLYEDNNYVKKSKSPLPWRWMALESLKTLTFSTSSDIWSYGVTMFELFTLGDTPFPNEEWSNEFVKRLESGMRFGRPEYSTQEIYAEIATCWEKQPELRPSFSLLRAFFEKLINRVTAGVPEGGGGLPAKAIALYLNNLEPCVDPIGGECYVNAANAEGFVNDLIYENLGDVRTTDFPPQLVAVGNTYTNL